MHFLASIKEIVVDIIQTGLLISKIVLSLSAHGQGLTTM